MSEKFTKGPWKATYDSQLQALIQIYNTEGASPGSSTTRPRHG